MDEKLLETIKKIRQLAKQNAEFDSAMRNMFSDATSSAHSTDDERLMKIEKYLGLDYYIDSMNPITDYNYIKEPNVKAQLISDSREMLRFRYGTRDHKIKFSEFCRYAQLQAEMLLNYFYTKKNDCDVHKITTHIIKFNPNANGLDKAQNILDISFSVKLWAFCTEFKMDFNIWNNIREVRNETSHRSPEEADKEMVVKYKESLKRQGYIIAPSGILLNWRELDEPHKNIFRNIIQKSDEYKKYKFQSWLSDKPYDTVIEAVNNINKKVKNNI